MKREPAPRACVARRVEAGSQGDAPRRVEAGSEGDGARGEREQECEARTAAHAIATRRTCKWVFISGRNKGLPSKCDEASILTDFFF